MTYKIQKNVPMPASKRGRGSPATHLKYPWPDMKVGDSFEAPVTQSSLAATARGWARRNRKTWTFATRKVAKNRCRVWRTK